MPCTFNHPSTIRTLLYESAESLSFVAPLNSIFEDIGAYGVIVIIIIIVCMCARAKLLDIDYSTSPRTDLVGFGL